MEPRNQQENTESSELVGVQQNEQKPMRKRTKVAGLAGIIIFVGGLVTGLSFSYNYNNKAKELIEKTPELKRAYDVEKDIGKEIKTALKSPEYREYVADGKSLLRKVFENPSSEDFYRNLIKKYDSSRSQEGIQETRQMVEDYRKKSGYGFFLGMLAMPTGCFIPLVYEYCLRRKEKKSK